MSLGCLPADTWNTDLYRATHQLSPTPEELENMKSRIAAALSLTGVLMAGSAAALVNTQVLNDSTTAEAGAAPVENLPTTSLATQVATTLPAATPAGAVTQPAPVEATTAQAQTASSPSTQAVYQIGDSGFVTLDTAGDALTLIDATPTPGWQVTEFENDGSLHVEVKFVTGTTEVEFKANLLFGVVTTSVESHDLSATVSSETSNTSHDDDDDGSDDDDEFEDGSDDD
jgi:hypothetical protein